MQFQFAIGDPVQTKNGALIGLVQERIYHEHPGGVRVKYVIFGLLVKPHRFGGRTLYDECESNLEPADKDAAEAEWLHFVPRKTKE